MSKIVRAVFEQIGKESDFGLIWRRFREYNENEFFSEKPPCTFLALIVMNFHAKNQENR